MNTSQMMLKEQINQYVSNRIRLKVKIFLNPFFLLAANTVVYDYVEQSPHYDNSDPYIDERELIDLPAVSQ